MPPKKLLIADEDIVMTDALSHLLTGRYLIKTCQDGLQAYSHCREWIPDLIVLDLELRQLDGISLLKQIARDGHTPMVLAATGFINHYVQETLLELNVGYLMRKPCKPEAVIEHIHSLNRKLRPPMPTADELIKPATAILAELGFANNRDGFRYLQAGIPLLTLDRNQRFSKELYPAIGRLCGGTESQIEKDIRESIQAAWKLRDDAVWSKYFGLDKNGTTPKITNTVFISTLADYLLTNYISL